jgi:heme a synthase
MTRADDHRPIALWLFGVSALIIVMVVLGGWVRLTHSGLSIVEWDVFSGILPPLDAQAWEAEFARYRQSPEYLQINAGMSIEAFRSIYLMEYLHRLLGRITGLAFVLPLLFFVVRGLIPRAHIPFYIGIGLLFALQGLIGWLMVKSGLIDQPRVSPFRLTLHLCTALVLLVACLWRGFDCSFPRTQTQPAAPSIRRLSLALLLALGVQIATGGLMAGFKAGYLSDTFPAMSGQLIPDGLWWISPWIANFVKNPLLIHFEHRWFAFGVLSLAFMLWYRTRQTAPPSHLHSGTRALLLILLAQTALGISTVLTHMPVSLASMHQTVAVAALSVGLFVAHRAYRP